MRLSLTSSTTLTVWLAATLPTMPARADAPAIIPIQGTLTDSGGTAIDGNHDVVLTVHDDASLDSPLYTESQAAVSFEAGSFIIYMGSETPLDLATFRDVGDAWLEVTIDGTEVIEPRFRLASVPYTGFAQYCDEALTLSTAAAADFAPASHTHAWSDIASGVPAGLADGDDVLSEAEVDAMVANNGYALDSSISTVGKSGSFDDLADVPAGLADGDDDVLGGMSCAGGQVAKRSGSAWACGDDLGLTGSGALGQVAMFDGAGGLSATNIYNTGAGRIGIGTTTPGYELGVNGRIAWGQSNLLGTNQTGSIELGDSTAVSTAPFIDLHYGTGSSEDYNVRLHNSGNGVLDIKTSSGGTVRIENGTITVPNNVRVGQHFMYAAPRRRAANLSAVAFHPSFNDGGDIVQYVGSQLRAGERTPGDGCTSLILYSPVRLPAGSMVRKLQCEFRDTSATEDFDAHVWLAKSAFGGPAASTMVADATAGAAVRNAAGPIWVVDDTISSTPVATNESFYVRVDFAHRTMPSGDCIEENTTAISFRGCFVEYELDRVDF